MAEKHFAFHLYLEVLEFSCRFHSWGCTVAHPFCDCWICCMLWGNLPGMLARSRGKVEHPRLFKWCLLPPCAFFMPDQDWNGSVIATKFFFVLWDMMRLWDSMRCDKFFEMTRWRWIATEWRCDTMCDNINISTDILHSISCCKDTSIIFNNHQSISMLLSLAQGLLQNQDSRIFVFLTGSGLPCD